MYLHCLVWTLLTPPKAELCRAWKPISSLSLSLRLKNEQWCLFPIHALASFEIPSLHVNCFHCNLALFLFSTEFSWTPNNFSIVCSLGLCIHSMKRYWLPNMWHINNELRSYRTVKYREYKLACLDHQWAPTCDMEISLHQKSIQNLENSQFQLCFLSLSSFARALNASPM